MSEVKTAGQIYLIEYICDDVSCDGRVVFTGQAKKGIDLKNPQLVHSCVKCKKLYFFKKKTYPAQIVEPVEQTELKLTSDN